MKILTGILFFVFFIMICIDFPSDCQPISKVSDCRNCDDITFEELSSASKIDIECPRFSWTNWRVKKYRVVVVSEDDAVVYDLNENKFSRELRFKLSNLERGSTVYFEQIVIGNNKTGEQITDNFSIQYN